MKITRLAIAVAVLLVWGSIAFATDYTWDSGGADETWEDVDNWGGAGYPDGNDDKATIPTGISDVITTGVGALTIGELDMQSGCTATITLGAALTISDDDAGENGNLTITAGTLDCNGKALIVEGAASITGILDANTNGNPSVTVVGNFTINTNGTYLATSGTTTISGNFNNNGTFTHNEGTVLFEGGLNVQQNGNVDPVFYNVTFDPGDYPYLFKGFTTVQRFFFSTGSVIYLYANNGIWTFGNDTQSGEIVVASGKKLTPNVSTIYIYAKNQLYPVQISGDDWSWSKRSAGANFHLKWVDFQLNIDTSKDGTGDVTITLDGDCEFDAFTVASGDTLDLNGYTATFGGAITPTGTFTTGGTTSLNLTGGSSTFSQALTLTDLTIGSGATLTTTSTITASGDVDITGTLAGGTEDHSFSSLTINSGGTYTATTGTTTITNNLTNSGTYTLTSGTTTVGGNITNSGTYTGSGTTILTAGDFINTGTFNSSGGGTLRFNSGNTQNMTPQAESNHGKIHLQTAFTYVKLLGDLICQDLTLDKETVLDRTGYDLDVRGDLENSGYIAGTSGDPYGIVSDSITDQAIAGATVTLHTPDGSIYSGTPQDNPQITDSLGKYNFYVEKGKYYLTATAQGYKDFTSSIFTEVEAPVLVNIEMEPLDFVAQNGLLISHSSNKTQAKRGDIITYFFKVKNTNSSPVLSPEISVKLPHNFKYIKDSALRDGVKSEDPEDTSGRLIFSPDNITGNTSITYSYRVRVGIDAYEGKNISEGIVSFTSQSQDISTGPAYSIVYIKSLFSPKGLVIGKVFEDTNGNGIQDIEEVPIPYVAILSEDGKVVLTDENGQYTIINFNYDTHVLKLDQRVLPGGPFAISGLNPPLDFPKDIPRISKTIDIPKSGITKANFPITQKERAKYREANKLAIASWEERLSGTAIGEDKELKETQSQKEILTGYYEKAMVYYRKGKYDEAISEWKKINKAYKETKESMEPVLSKKSRETPQTEFILVGLADGEIGKLQRFGNVHATAISEEKSLHKELYKNGRVAFYLKGIIQGKYLLTARVDTSKDLEDEIYEAIDADRYYPIYGDSSTQINETDSQDPIYVALTWNKNFIKYGNFSTDEFSNVEYAKYSRTLPGLKIHLEGDRAEVTSFASHSRQVPRKDIINPRALSGPYYLSRNPVIEQSERVYLEIHDKDKDDVILSTVSYERDKDYDMFYDDGYIYFSEPIRSEDRFGNPQYIIVQYEYSPPLDPQYITQGVRLQIEPIPETFTLGFTNIAQNADNLHLTGGDTEIKLFGGTTTLSGEYTYSDNNFNNYATKAQISSTLIPKLNFSGHYLNVNDGFSNPTGTLEQGVREYRAKVSYNILKPTDIILDHYRRRFILSCMRTTYYGGELINRWDRLALSGKATYERQKDEVLTYNGLSDMKWTTLGGDLSYRLTKKITLHYGYEWKDEIESLPLDDDAKQYNTFTGRIDYQLDPDNLLYLRNDHIEASGYMKNISAVGVEQILDEKTTSYAEYEKEGNTLRQNMGYKSKVKLTKWLSSNVSFERSRVSGATSVDSDASSISLEAKPKDELWLASKVECRHYQKTKEYNLNYESKGELTPDLTAFSKGSFSRAKDNDTCTTTRRDKQGVIGLSYRPVSCDRLNVIGKYEYKRKENIQIVSQESQTVNHIGSVEGAYDLTKNMTLGARYAYNKSVEKGQDHIDKAHVNLFVTSLNYRLTPRLDILTEGRYIYLHETGDWKLGSSIEVGYKPIKDLRLGVGYTFTEYNDGLSMGSVKGDDYISGGPYFKLTLTPSF